MRHFDEEEAFHAKDRKESRKERRLAQKNDRSQFKKTDQSTPKEPADFSHLARGRVIAITGEGVFVDVAGKKHLCSLKGVLKKEKLQVKNLLAVGDFVRLTPELAIVQIERRTSVLARTDISGKKEQLIAANVDQVIIVVSIVSPPLKPALVDRYLIAALKGNIHPIIVINKIDLLETATPEEKSRFEAFLYAYEMLGIPLLSISVVKQLGLDALRALLQNKVSVFAGQSGVGKSSLLNISFDMNQSVGKLSVKTEKGSHTTTRAELLPLIGGGYSIDTPGVRSFGIWGLKKEDLINHFEEITTIASGCKYPDCAHLDEPECKVKEAVSLEKISSLRYESYLTLFQETLAEEKGTTWGS